MILPLELLCQAVLSYETFKALKAAPPPRKRRNANTEARDDGDAIPRHTAYAANKRKRAMKVMLRAWLVYVIAIPLERILDYSLGWILPFYSSFRILAVLAFVAYHKTTGDIGYHHFLLPFLKAREPSLDWIFAWLNEVLDVACYILVLITKQIFRITSIALSPIKQLSRKTIAILQSTKTTLQRSNRPPPSETVDTDTSLLAASTDTNTTKTPRRSKRASKPRYSQIATPYVPGHLVADESVYPPVQPRLHPAERTADDVSAFQEAMDRAQAAFYEVSSPPLASRVEDDDGDRAISGYSREANDLFLPTQQRARTRRQNGRIDGTMQHSNSQQELHGQLSSTLRNPVSRQEIPVNGPSEKALGKRHRDANAKHDNAEATASSPEKILKTGSFESSRNATSTSHSVSRSNANGRPALRQTRQGKLRLPQRPLVSASDEAVSSAAISSAAQTARQRALLERRYAKSGGKIT